MTAQSTPKQNSGRPRDPSKDTAVLGATRKLLTHGGYQAATIAAIASEAGVGAPTIYRRWPNRETLIEDAVYNTGDFEPPSSAGDLVADVATWVRFFLDHQAEPTNRAALPGLLTAYQNDIEQYRKLLSRIEVDIRHLFTEMVVDSIPLADDTARVQRAEAAFDLMVGTVVVRALIFGLHDDDRFCADTTQALVALLRSEWTAN